MHILMVSSFIISEIYAFAQTIWLLTNNLYGAETLPSTLNTFTQIQYTLVPFDSTVTENQKNFSASSIFCLAFFLNVKATIK